MTTEDQWIGDLGHLALADAMLGALLTDILKILAYAIYPDSPGKVDDGQTTKQSAQLVRKRLEADPDLFGDGAGQWLTTALDITEVRNELLHAIALDQCGVCGSASRFLHPRSGKEVDRSDSTIHDLTERMWALCTSGMPIAEDISKRVNSRIEMYARRVADATDEIQTPPQVFPHHVTRKCANCDANGAGSLTIHVGTAIEVWPAHRRQEMLDKLRNDKGDVPA